MKNYGIIRAAAATMATKVAKPSANAATIKEMIDQAVHNEVSILVLPELSICGYSCGDLFGQSLLLRRCEEEIAGIAGYSYEKNIAVIVGAPVSFNGRLYDCAIIIKDGEVKGVVPKTYVSCNDSGRFASGSDLIHGPEIFYAGFNCIISPNQIFEVGNISFAIEIGEDMTCPVPPSSYHSLAGAHVIAGLASGRETLMHRARTEEFLSRHSTSLHNAYIYSSAYCDSSQDHVFTGYSSVWEQGTLLAKTDEDSKTQLAIADIDFERIDSLRRKSSVFFSVTPDGTPSASYDLLYSRVYLGEMCYTDFSKSFFRHIERHPFAPENDMESRCRTILDLQVKALANRLRRIGSKAVIGISGGLDSTLALIVTTLAFDRLKKEGNQSWDHKDITAVTMPGFGTTSRTKNNAWDLMQALGVSCKEISIVPACEQHFKDICHDSKVHDATYENTQARERTQILMDIANQTGSIVIGTGDLSELALGWATYNGDHMSMYGVNADIPKTLVKGLVKWAAEHKFQGMSAEDGRSIKEILLDIVNTPISPELLPATDMGEINQVTEDLVGPYELHDFFLYNFVRFGYEPEKILFLAQRAFDDYDADIIKKWLTTFIRRFFSQQFKRSCMPDGPKVGSVALSPRGSWQMASDAWSDDFLAEF